MAFTVEDFEDLYRLLSEHPDWRARLRPLILGDAFVELPTRMAAVEKELGEIRAVLEQLGERLGQVVSGLEALGDRQNRAEGRLGNIEGELLQLKYADNMGNWFRSQVTRPQRMFIDDLDLLLRAVEEGVVSEEDVDRVSRADLIVRGKSRADQGSELLLLAEVSTTVNLDDVERAEQAAEVLRRAGYNARGWVGGYRATSDALTRAEELKVFVDLRRQAG